MRMRFVAKPQPRAGTNCASDRVRWLFLGCALGAGAAYFCDPVSGSLRRNLARDFVASRFRRFGTSTLGTIRWRAGAFHGLTHRGFEEWSVPNDATLKQRVESELFADRSLPKGAINVSAEAGIVVLRGQVQHQQEIERIEAAVRDMPGVRGVHSLLHLPNTPIPSRGSVLPAE